MDSIWNSSAIKYIVWGCIIPMEIRVPILQKVISFGCRNILFQAKFPSPSINSKIVSEINEFSNNFLE